MPHDDMAQKFKVIFEEAVAIKKAESMNRTDSEVAILKLDEIQKRLDELVRKLYKI